MSGWPDFLAQALADKQAAARMRVRGAGDTWPNNAIDFGSNDYLGLACHPEVLAAASEPAPGDARDTGTRFGSGASPVLSGYTPAHRMLETSLAQLAGTEAALVFSSGYSCNVGVLACLAQPGDLILSDELNHASLIDGCRLSKAERVIYPHNDVAAVEALLEARRQDFARVLLVTESVFSMDGDLAPLEHLAEVCQRFGVGLVVDEAHATGVYGDRGGGLITELGLQDAVLVKLGTLSKALGAIGGYACGSQLLVDYLINHCRSYLFSTAPPVPVMRAATQAIRMLAGMQAERQRLRHDSRQLRQILSEQGWNVPAGDSPIVPVIVGPEAEVLALGGHLREQGLYVPAIRPPTVPVNTSRLRVSLSSAHSWEQIEYLLAALATPSSKSTLN